MTLPTANRDNVQPPAAAPKRRWQFSIWTLLVVMTGICILLAIPGAAILFASVGFWLIVAGGIVTVILALQAPGYYVLQRIRTAAAAEHNSASPDQASSRPPATPDSTAPSRCD